MDVRMQRAFKKMANGTLGGMSRVATPVSRFWNPVRVGDSGALVYDPSLNTSPDEQGWAEDEDWDAVISYPGDIAVLETGGLEHSALAVGHYTQLVFTGRIVSDGAFADGIDLILTSTSFSAVYAITDVGVYQILASFPFIALVDGSVDTSVMHTYTVTLFGSTTSFWIDGVLIATSVAFAATGPVVAVGFGGGPGTEEFETEGWTAYP